MTPARTPSDTLFSSALPSNFAESYEGLLVTPLFRPWAEILLDRLALGPRARVLDIACGTGIAARLANTRLGGEGHVVGVDRSPVMLAVARAVAPEIDWREGDAAALPVRADERFDVALCHQGLQFFPDKLAALRTMRSALVPGGQAAVGVWRALEENGLFSDLGRVAEGFVGPVADARHSFADAAALAQLLGDSGFDEVHVEAVRHETCFELDPADLARLNATAVIGMSSLGKTMSDAERQGMSAAIVQASLPAIARYTRDGVIRFETSANIATARA